MRSMSLVTSASLILTFGFTSLTGVAGSGAESRTNTIEACGAAYRDSSGKAHSFLLPQLSKSLAVEETFILPSNAPANVLQIQCGRSSLVPLITDVKVLAAGYPFSVLSGGRIGTLEIIDGLLRFDMDLGEMTDPETEQIQIILNEGQRLLLELESSTEQSASAKVAP